MLLQNIPYDTLLEKVFKIEQQQLSLKFSLNITKYQQNAAAIFIYTISDTMSFCFLVSL